MKLQRRQADQSRHGLFISLLQGLHHCACHCLPDIFCQAAAVHLWSASGLSVSVAAAVQLPHGASSACSAMESDDWSPVINAQTQSTLENSTAAPPASPVDAAAIAAEASARGAAAATAAANGPPQRVTPFAQAYVHRSIGNHCFTGKMQQQHLSALCIIIELCMGATRLLCLEMNSRSTTRVSYQLLLLASTLASQNLHPADLIIALHCQQTGCLSEGELLPQISLYSALGGATTPL